MNRRTLFLGPPGSGKGTHAKRISSDFGVPHVSTGDMLRAEVARGTQLGTEAKHLMDAGQLVPDELVLQMVVERLSQPDASRGWILDGFPRTTPQAKELDAQLEPRGIDLVITLDVSRQEILDRVTGRRVCPRGHVYHLETDPPQVAGICDVDGEVLVQREDDSAGVITQRLEVYDRETRPLIDHYERAGVLRHIDGTSSPDRVYARVTEAFREIS
jgi:adenylate kinase